jgi:long-chain acyl-CoA synthetase
MLISGRKNLPMKNCSRLFDCIRYQMENFPLEVMLAAKEKGTWRKYSTQEVEKTANAITAGLLSLGISGNDGTAEGQDKIAIISGNRPEWLMLDLAVQQTGALLVPVYPTTNPREMEFIFNDAEVKYLFVSNADLLEKVESVVPKIPSLRAVYTFDEIPGTKNWKEIAALGTPEWMDKVEAAKAAVKPDQLATIIYTSGTTGTPKGVMLSHNNILSNIRNAKASFPFDDNPQLKVLSFLPLNHIFEKMVSYIYLFSGNNIYYAESLETIGDNLREVKPDGFTTVPRLLEKVFEKIMDKGSSLKGVARKLFFWAVKLGKQYDTIEKKSLWYRFRLFLANKIIFRKWRDALGGNIKFIITGGAACQPRLLRIFNAGGIPVYEGYGPTENSPVITVNQRKETGINYLGAVGPVIPGQEVKLLEDGEICVKGPSVMVGYYKRPDLTAETIVDGWLLTGDIGMWIEVKGKKILKITDRKKELFKTSGGKYVAPQPIENKLKESPFIEQVLVVGAEKKFVGALIVPAFEHLKRWCAEQNITETEPAAIIRSKQVNDLYKDIVERFNVNFNHVEQVKKFELLPAEWTIDGGEMTPKMSLKRKVIMEKYRDAIERIYA